MARKIATKRRQNSNIGALMLAFVTFILGYLVATIFDVSHLSGWVSSRLSPTPAKPAAIVETKAADLPKPKFEFYTLLAKDQQIPTTPTTVTTPAPIQASKPLPETPATKIASTPASTPPIDLTVTQKLPLLHDSLSSSAREVKPSKPQETSMKRESQQSRYVIQIGSFKNRYEAEKIKANLTMRGFSVMVVSMAQQQVTWYRVLIGPFASLPEAQRVHRLFAQRERITGMIRKLDV